MTDASSASAVPVAQPRPEPLWPEGAPGALGSAEADLPSITVFPALPELANGCAVVICPGGGYRALMMTYEGTDVARWLNTQGIAGIVLKYRIAPYRHPAPLQDAQRALRTVRARAAEWQLDPRHIGIMGFSAGGHVAASAGTLFDAGDPLAADPIERASSRPDFMVLVYPVVSMGEKAHAGSREKLLGSDPKAADVDLLSCEKQVTPDTPPTFLVHSIQDKTVSFENSALFYAALRSRNVPAEYLELPTGGHGLGCGHSQEWAQWQAACLNWFKVSGVLNRSEK